MNLLPISSEVKALGDKTNLRMARNTKKKNNNKKEKENVDLKKTVKRAVRERKPRDVGKKKPAISQSIQSKVKDLEKAAYCFGFSDSDVDEGVPNYNGELTEFDNSKPYRLALYVKPSKRIRLEPSLAQQIQNLNPTLNITNVTMNNSTISAKKRLASESVMSPDRTKWKVPYSSTPKETKKNQSKMVQKKITDVLKHTPKRTRPTNAEQQFISFFENSPSTEEEKSPPSKVQKVNPKENEVQKGESKEDKTEVTCFQKPSRRSYIKKPRPLREPEDEPTTDEVLKSIEKAKKKGRNKKPEKEDEEFEKWSRSMNSMFSEVEQFDLSID